MIAATALVLLALFAAGECKKLKLLARPLDSIVPFSAKEEAKIRADFIKKGQDYVDEVHDGPNADDASFGGQDGTAHMRRVPIFEDAQQAGKDISKKLVKNINDQLDSLKCNKRKDEDETACVWAVKCVMAHALTSHWDKLHLLSDACQKIINQCWRGALDALLQSDGPRRSAVGRGVGAAVAP